MILVRPWVGRVSVTVTLVASDGPVFAATIV